jgi:hypothetical protein
MLGAQEGQAELVQAVAVAAKAAKVETLMAAPALVGQEDPDKLPQ